jgi:hypothetical protein
MSPVRPSCLISDEIAFVLLMAVVYFQVRYMMGLYAVKFRKELEHRDYKLKMVNWENQNVLEKFASDFASATRRIEPLEGRFEALEDMLKGLISAETSILKSATTRLRALLSENWGSKKPELQARIDEAAQREAAWQKAASWA